MNLDCESKEGGRDIYREKGKKMKKIVVAFREGEKKQLNGDNRKIWSQTDGKTHEWKNGYENLDWEPFIEERFEDLREKELRSQMDGWERQETWEKDVRHVRENEKSCKCIKTLLPSRRACTYWNGWDMKMGPQTARRHRNSSDHLISCRAPKQLP